jgi:hypothetical protein
MVAGPARSSSPVPGTNSAVRPFASAGPNATGGLGRIGDSGPEGSPGDTRSNRAMQTGSLRFPLRRRRLRGIVFVTLAMCTLILVAAVASRVGHASNAAAAVPIPAFPRTLSPQAAPNPPAPPATTTSAPANPSPTVSSDVTTATVRIEKPAVVGRVWIDGKKVSAPSVLTTCGAHQIKVGHGHARSVQIPCGGEFVVSR